MLNQFVEGLGMKQSPPVRGNVAAIRKALGLTTDDVRRSGGGHERVGRVLADFWSSRFLEIGTDGASRNRQQGNGHEERPHT
jgi:hypothetical protein